MSKLDQAKMLMQIRKIQKELQSEVLEVTAGEGAVKIEITGEQKIGKIKIDPDFIDLEDIGQLERWVEEAVKDAIKASQELAQEKLAPYMGMLGNLGM